MSVRRVMGIETEYGISVPGDPTANPMVLSGNVVNAYARSVGVRVGRHGWDYSDEAPLRDARGFELGRVGAHPSQLTDVEDPTLANVVLTNGARLYVDHAHPEYASPEVTTPRAAVIWDRAGESIMLDAVRRLAVPGVPGVNLYKNNTDGKGASYGTHENYLMRRSTPFAAVVAQLTPFFVVRQVICGSGRVGIGQVTRTPGFQISQRADFFEAEVGLETTLKRPIINTRDEPHAVADLYRRLHVIIGDANHADVANLLKLGMTSLVLALIEDEAITRPLSIRSPVAALQAVSHDPSLTHLVELTDGRSMTALDVLENYLEQVIAYLDGRDDSAAADTAEVVHWWTEVLTKLRRDPMSAAGEVDWVAKLRLVQGYRDRDALPWGDPRLSAIDIQWSDVRPEKGLAEKLRARGALTPLVDPAAIAAAVTEPPEDTRAYFRGACLRRYPDEIVSASWDSLIFDLREAHALRRVPMLEPLRGTREQVGDLIEASPDAAALLRALQSSQRPAG